MFKQLRAIFTPCLLSLLLILVSCKSATQKVSLLPTSIPPNTPLPTPALLTPAPTQIPPLLTNTPAPTATALPPLPTDTPAPTATAIPHPTNTPEPVATETSAPEIAPVRSSKGAAYNYEDLEFNVQYPANWSGSFANGTLTIVDPSGQPQLHIRAYLHQNYLSIETVAHRALPPPVQASLILTPTTISDRPALLTNADTTFIDVGGRYLAFEVMVDSAEIIQIMQTFSAEASTFNGNYHLFSSENWIAQGYAHVGTDEIFTVQRRDGSAGYTLVQRLVLPGLGGSLAAPLFFDPTEQHFYYNDQVAADGCGIYFNNGAMQQVELHSGVQITLVDTSGTGHTLSPDGQRVAFLYNHNGNQFTLHQFDLATQSRQTVDFSLEGERPLAGDLIFSPDGQKMAFTILPNACRGGSLIGILDLTSAEIKLYDPQDGHTWYRPIAWQNDIISLQANNLDSAEYHHLDLQSGTFTP